MINIPDTTRAITSLTSVSRTSSLREQSRPESKDDQITVENGSLVLNKRSLSNDKMSSDTMAPVFLYQRGSSLRQNGKTAFPISSPNPNNHHPFKIIKQIETSPRTSECNLDHDIISTVKVSSQRLKLKHRSQISTQGGPLIPDHNLMKEPPRDSITFTPRPPLVKRFSSDQEEPNSDIDMNQSNKNSRFYQIFPPTAAPRPPISPTRGIVQTTKSTTGTTANSIEKNEKPTDYIDEDTSELEDILNSDCETPPPSNNPIEIVKYTKYRSSLRKGSDSPNQSDGASRGSPSPTKTVKWNLNTEVKKIPRSRSLNGKHKSSKSKSYRSASDRKASIASITDQKLVESHETYISHYTTLIRHQITALEDLRHGRISINNYKENLGESLSNQKQMISALQGMLEDTTLGQEKPLPI